MSRNSKDKNDRPSFVWNTTEKINSLPNLFGHFSYFVPKNPL